MSKLPKLKLKMPDEHEVIRNFEDAENLLVDLELLAVVEGQLIYSYEELVQLATEDAYKDKEFLEIMLVPYLMGG